MSTILTHPQDQLDRNRRQDVPCPACDAGRLEPFFEIAQAPILCNVLCETREAATRVPHGRICLGFCASCGHIYNTAFDSDLMAYDGAYENSLQFSPRFRAYLESCARSLVQRYSLRDKQIVEIGCGQGDFLSLLCSLGPNRGMGFDPSFDAAKADTALVNGVSIQSRLYSHEDAGQHADLICCRHVLEHLPKPLQFLRDLRHAIGARLDTILFFEVPNAMFTIDRLAIWDIIYEHCSYFTPASLRRIFELAGFDVLRVDEVYDGQFLSIEARSGNAAAPDSPDLTLLSESVRRFADTYRSKLDLWRHRLDRIARENHRAVIWGAGSKGVMFLNNLSISPDLVPLAVDLNPRKHGRFVVGTGQRIIGPAMLAQEFVPEIVIIMNGIYRDEIKATLGECGITNVSVEVA